MKNIVSLETTYAIPLGIPRALKTVFVAFPAVSGAVIELQRAPGYALVVVEYEAEKIAEGALGRVGP